MGNRPRRLGELLKKEISEIVMRGIKDPRIAFVSITSVTCTHDLRHARVFISVLGTEKERKSTIAGLRSATGYIRREIAHRLSLKYTPELKFEYDDSIEEGSRILALIDSVIKEDGRDSDD
jgi:ribosome-binding factor A